MCKKIVDFIFSFHQLTYIYVFCYGMFCITSGIGIWPFIIGSPILFIVAQKFFDFVLTFGTEESED